MKVESMTRAELIRATGFSGTAVDGWLRVGCPRLKSGRFSLPAVIRWLVEERTAANSASPDRERWLRVRADREEMRLARDQGVLVPLPMVSKIMERLHVNYRGKLVSLPGRIAPQIVAVSSIPEVKAILEEAIHEAMTEMTRLDPDQLTNEIVTATGIAVDGRRKNDASSTRTNRE